MFTLTPKPFACNELQTFSAHPVTCNVNQRRATRCLQQTFTHNTRMRDRQMNESQKRDILKSISTSGVSLVENRSTNEMISSQKELSQIANNSSGILQIHSSAIKKFKLILSQPLALSTLSSFEIRCCLCKKVISYPCWYYDIRYAINHFHYFVCFDSKSKDRPSTKCYRK